MNRPVREERRAARSEVEEVAPGILRLQLPIALPGLGHVNCYAMEDERGVALVDPGLPGPATTRALRSRLHQAGWRLRDVHTVVITHSHPDHFGQAGLIRRISGADVITHRSFRTFLDPAAEDDDEDLEVRVDDRAMVEAARGQPHGPFATQHPWGGSGRIVPWRRKLAYRAMRVVSTRLLPTPLPTRRVVDGEPLRLGRREWQAVHTPGHTIDHLCLYDPADGVMISGDHVLPTITPHISGVSSVGDPLAEFFTSLDRMTTFTATATVLPAHGLEFADLAGRAEAIKRHHHERLDVLREASDHLGQATVEDYMRELFAERSWGPMAASETYAHLEHLRRLGEASVDDGGAELRYAF